MLYWLCPKKDWGIFILGHLKKKKKELSLSETYAMERTIMLFWVCHYVEMVDFSSLFNWDIGEMGKQKSDLIGKKLSMYGSYIWELQY